jgi:hypothetical protein
MHADAGVHVEFAFSDVARLALEMDLDTAEPLVPAGFMARAHLAVPGDLLQLPGTHGLFVVAQRLWTLNGGRPTLRLVLDVLVQDQA